MNASRNILKASYKLHHVGEKKAGLWQITMSEEIKQLMPIVVWWLMLTLDGTQHGLALVRIKWLFLCWLKCNQ